MENDSIVVHEIKMELYAIVISFQNCQKIALFRHEENIL